MVALACSKHKHTQTANPLLEHICPSSKSEGKLGELIRGWGDEAEARPTPSALILREKPKGLNKPVLSS